METLIKYYDNLSEIIDTYDFNEKDESILIDILELLIHLILIEVRKSVWLFVWLFQLTM